MFPYFARLVWAIQQQGRVLFGRVEDLITLEEVELVNGDEICALNQVCALDWPRPKAQMRDRHRARLFRVVDKISLRVIRRFFANDLYRVLIRTDRAVGPQTPEQRAYLIGGFVGEVEIERQTVISHVVDNANAEMVLGSELRHFVEDALNHCRREFFGTQTVAAADDARQCNTQLR